MITLEESASRDQMRTVMPAPSPPQACERVSTRRRWGRVVLLVLLAGIGALGWHIYTGQRAIHQLREAGFVMESQDWLGPRVWAAVRRDWRLVFNSGIWKSRPSLWKLEGAKAGELRNLDAAAGPLRRINPEWLVLGGCTTLENVDGLKGFTSLTALTLVDCHELQNLDGLKGLTSLRELRLSGCHRLQNLDGLKGLNMLDRLELWNCHRLQNVDDLKGLIALHALTLKDCRDLQNVDGLKGLAALLELKLLRCPALKNVDALAGLKSLRSISLSGCSALQDVNSLKRLPGLQHHDTRFWWELTSDKLEL